MFSAGDWRPMDVATGECGGGDAAGVIIDGVSTEDGSTETRTGEEWGREDAGGG